VSAPAGSAASELAGVCETSGGVEELIGRAPQHLPDVRYRHVDHVARRGVRALVRHHQARIHGARH
jgi:hypothetical protein